jgi:beta-lactam-binding protein with PASTA domain
MKRFLRALGYLALFGVGVAGGVVLLLKVSFSGTRTVAPPVAGLTVQQAEFQARRSHLQFQVQSERFDLQMEKGRVITQVPSPGMASRRGQTLLVVVSKGVERVQVPSLVGMRLDEAQIQMRQSGLRLASTAYIHSPVAVQTVAAQDPPAGSAVPRDSDVSLLVSVGPQARTFVSPDLAGRSLSLAQNGLGQYGIQVGPARSVRMSGTPPGEILSQVPAPGMPLQAGSVVQLTVSQP